MEHERTLVTASYRICGQYDTADTLWDIIAWKRVDDGIKQLIHSYQQHDVDRIKEDVSRRGTLSPRSFTMVAGRVMGRLTSVIKRERLTSAKSPGSTPRLCTGKPVILFEEMPTSGSLANSIAVPNAPVKMHRTHTTGNDIL